MEVTLHQLPWINCQPRSFFSSRLWLIETPTAAHLQRIERLQRAQPKWDIYVTILPSRPQGSLGKRTQKEDKGVRCSTCKVARVWSPRCVLYQDDTNEHAKLNGEKPTGLQPYTKNYRQLKETGSRSRRGSLPQGSAHQMVLHRQMVSPANK